MNRHLHRAIASMSVGALTAVFGAAAVMATTPATAASRSPVVTEATAVARAETALKTNFESVEATDEDEFHVVRTIRDPDGASHVRYSRTYQGLPVYGGDIVVHNRPDGAYAGSSVGLAEPLRLDIKPTLAAKDAAETAKRQFAGKVDSVADPVLVIEAASGFGRLAYETVVSGTAADGQTPSVLHVFVDAHKGEVIRSSDEVESIVFSPIDGVGHSYYAGDVTLHATYTDLYVGFKNRLIDQLAGSSKTCDMGNATTACSEPFPDEDAVWGDGTLADRATVAADAHYGSGVAYDYFQSVHGHSGVAGDTRGVTSRVHFGNETSNAWWWGSAKTMTFGDGTDNAHPYVSLDVVGHEWSHGVTENLAGLIYAGESGGLNESTSDIFGTAIEFHANNPDDPGDYEIGEKIDDFPPPGGAIRYMYNPYRDGLSYSCYAGHFPDTYPVHMSSGIGNHFFFNLAEGTGDTPYGFSPLCENAPPMTGIGREAAERIWFRALNVYFTSSTSYTNADNPGNTARAYTLKAAADLYGRCSRQVRAVNAAWVAVNVPSSTICSLLEVDLGHLTMFTGDSATVAIQTFGEPETDPAVLTLSASGLPEGAQAVFDPREVRAGDRATMLIRLPSFVRPGKYQVTITAVSKGASDSVTLPLTVVERE